MDPGVPVPPFRRAFDAAPNPLVARNALGITAASGGPFQPLDGDLTALAGLTGTNTIYYRSGTDTWSPVSMGANMSFTGGVLNSTAGGGGGISDAPSDSKTYGRKNAAWVDLALSYQPLDGDLTAIAALTGTSTIYYRSAIDTWSPVTVGTGLSFSSGTLSCTVSTAGLQPLDATLTALAAYNTNGLLTQTAADTFTGRTLTGPAAGITVSNGNGVAGNPTLALANDLAALEALSGTSTIYYRSGTDAWSAVTIGTGLTFSGGTLAASGGGGDVFLAGNNTFTGSNYFNLGSNLPLVVGHSAKIATSYAVDVNGASIVSGIANSRWSNDTTGAELLLRKSRGASVGTNTVVSSGDTLGKVSFAGNAGAGFQSGGPSVSGICNSAPFGTNTPGYIDISAVNISGVSSSVATFATGAGGAQLGTSPSASSNNTEIATTAFVQGAVGNSAWTSWTPTVSAGSGSFTTVSATGRYKQIGKTVFFSLHIAITTNGTAATYVNATLPTTSANDTVYYIAHGREVAAVGIILQGFITPNSNVLSITDATNGYPGGSARTLVMTGFYQTA